LIVTATRTKAYLSSSCPGFLLRFAILRQVFNPLLKDDARIMVFSTFINWYSSFSLTAALLGVFLSMSAQARDLENTLYLDLKDGRVVIELRPDLAPKHVARIKELARQGFYDGLKFHRVISGFMAQTGDPRGDGTGGSGFKLKAEFSDAPHIRGTASMARAADPNSADSQFFICLADVPHLNGQYTVWGQVVEGMDFVDSIKKGEAARNGAIAGEADKIVKMRVAADVKE
jgi:peptidylprolyl isomerase